VGAQGFRFIDAVNGRTAANGGTGTLANPWRTLADMRAASGTAGMITYFRAGTYTPEGLPAQLFPIPPGSYVFFDEPSHSVAWLAYPGDARPVIDFGHTPGDMDTPVFRMRGNSIYLDGLETTRSHLMAFQISNDGVGTSAPIFRRMHMHDTGPGIDGTNSAFIMFRTGSPMNDLVIQDSEFFRITGEK
jgi:hypothetical protein